MKQSQILELLCSYDERNITGVISVFEGKELIESHKKSLIKDNSSCYCNNCFTGKTKLAEYILKSNELLESAADQLQDFEENGYHNHTAMEIYKHLSID